MRWIKAVVFAVILLTSSVELALADVVVSSSSSASGGINFGNQEPKEDQTTTILVAVITGMFGLFGTVIAAIITKGRGNRSAATRRRSRATQSNAPDKRSVESTR